MMFWEWVAFAIAGIGGAGIILAAAKITRRRTLARFAPLGAGVCFLATEIWADYHWAADAKANLPARAQLVAEIRESSALKPWAWIAPPVRRISAVAILSEEYAPRVLVELHLMSRWQSPLLTYQWFDCSRALRANGLITTSAPPPTEQEAWASLPSHDPYLHAACKNMRVSL